MNRNMNNHDGEKAIFDENPVKSERFFNYRIRTIDYAENVDKIAFFLLTFIFAVGILLFVRKSKDR